MHWVEIQEFCSSKFATKKIENFAVVVNVEFVRKTSNDPQLYINLSRALSKCK